MSSVNALSASPKSIYNPSEKEKSEKSSPPSHPFAPPQLTPPSSEYAFVNAISELCELKNTLLSSSKERLVTLKTQTEEASSLYLESLKKTAEEASKRDFWGFLKKGATSMLSALSLICGFSTLSAGGSVLAGGALVASGFFSIANLTLTEGKNWDWLTERMSFENETSKENFKRLFPTAVGILAAAMAATGSASSIASNSLDFTQKAASMAQGALNLFHTGSTLGKGLSESKLHFAQADFTIAEANLNQLDSKQELLNMEMTSLLSQFDTIIKQSKRAVQSITATKLHLT